MRAFIASSSSHLAEPFNLAGGENQTRHDQIAAGLDSRSNLLLSRCVGNPVLDTSNDSPTGAVVQLMCCARCKVDLPDSDQR
jgi:hypothetical protein